MRELTKTILAGVSILFITVIFAWIVPSYFEARAYNQITGKDITTFQAMFVELRVQGDGK